MKRRKWKATLWNNTDFPHGAAFHTLGELRLFLRTYYTGEAGSLYSESWTVEGDYPPSLYDLLDPPETDAGHWGRCHHM